MKHVYAILIKYVIVTVVLEIVLSWLTNVTLARILYISAAVTILAYIIGDLLILPITNNVVATIADLGLATFIIYMYRYVWPVSGIALSDAIIAAVIIAVGEWFFHKYLARNVFPNKTPA